MSFHIGGTPLTAQTYKDMTAFEVSEMFQFPIDREYKPEGMSFVTMTEANELKPLAIGIAQVLNSTGEFLLSHGYKDLASFILDVTKPSNDSSPSAKNLVDKVSLLEPVSYEGFVKSCGRYLISLTCYHLLVNQSLTWASRSYYCGWKT